VQEMQKLIERDRPTQHAPATISSGWHIIRCLPNLELTASIGLNARGYQAYCPSEYAMVRTNRIENGRRVMTMRPKAMLPGYAFVRFASGNWDFEGVRRVKGVSDFMRKMDSRGEMVPAGLTYAEVEKMRQEDALAFAAYQKEQARRDAEAAAKASGKPEVEFAVGKVVRVDGPTGEPWIATMLEERGTKRIQVLKDNAKIIVPHSRIHPFE
jgi:transcription antitermination factor NusG